MECSNNAWLYARTLLNSNESMYYFTRKSLIMQSFFRAIAFGSKDYKRLSRHVHLARFSFNKTLGQRDHMRLL